MVRIKGRGEGLVRSKGGGREWSEAREGEGVVRSKGGGGNGVKQEKGEGVVRSQAEERERRADRKGERTGGWWAAPSLPFMMRGHWHHLIVAVRGGTRSRRLIVVICLLTSFVAVHHPPLSVARSCPSSCLASLPCVWSWVTWRVLAVERSCAVDAGGVA